MLYKDKVASIDGCFRACCAVLLKGRLLKGSAFGGVWWEEAVGGSYN